MKENWKYKKLFYVMLGIVIISLGFTAVILSGLMDDADGKEGRYWFFEESMQTGNPVKLENAYIYSNASGQFEFLYDNITYTIEGKLAEEFSGVADVIVEGDKIAKVYIKPEERSGVLHSYDDKSLAVICEATDVEASADGSTVTEQVESLVRKESIPVYKMKEDKVVQSNWNQVIIGTSKVRCVMDGGQVSAMIIEESLPSDIRVVIKNGSSIYYSELFVKKQSDGSLVNVAEAMQAQKVKEFEIADESGLVLCDAQGKSLGEAYEGMFRVLQTEEGMVLINQLPIETYVKYVLPSEMPKSFHEEALKAQAVCARTFAYAHMSNQSYAKFGANLDDSTAFQVYHSTGRFEETDAAVDATAGEFITCNGELITCYYFSTSAGMTNDMSVWGSKTPEYIAMRKSEDTQSPFYKWTAYLDTANVKEDSYGKLTAAEVISKNNAGYVTELKLTYENKTITLKNENDIRATMGKYLEETVLNNGKVRTDLSMIPSASFTVTEVSEGKIVLTGGGFGHGIGMSQYGADQMADAGSDYKTIIEYYFNHVAVKK